MKTNSDMVQSIQEFISSDLGGTGTGADVPVDCISCGKEKKMYVNAISGLAYCFVCGYSANFMKLLSDLRGISIQEAHTEYMAILSEQWRAVEKRTTGDTDLDVLLRAFDGEEKDKGVQRILMPPGAIPIISRYASKGREYLKGRGFTTFDWSPAGLYFAPMKLKGRRVMHIIFPDYDEIGSLRYWTTRAIREGKGVVKTLHPTGIGHPFLFGEHTIDDHDTLIIVEGPMDMLALYGMSACLLGKRFHAEQLDAMEKYTNVVIALDRDAMHDDQVINAMEAMLGRGINLRAILKWPKGVNDPADLCAKYTWPSATMRIIALVKQSVEVNTTNLLTMRLA